MNNGNGLEKLVDVAKAAEILGLARKTVYAWSEQGRLPAYRIGRALRFRESELRDYIEASRLVPLTKSGSGHKFHHEQTATGGA